MRTQEKTLSNMATDNPADSRAGTIIGVVIALCTLSSICVALRFYARMHIRKNVGIDDWMTLAALVSCARFVSVVEKALPAAIPSRKITPDDSTWCVFLGSGSTLRRWHVPDDSIRPRASHIYP